MDFPSLSGLSCIRNAPLKFELFEALAEAYSQSLPEIQSKILGALEGSYTPVVACDAHGGRTILDWALIYIGKDSVGSLTRLAKHPVKSVRCGSAELLNEIGKSSASDKNVEPAPVLTCEFAETASEESESWFRWWQRNNSKIQFPTLPDFPM
jgi:hypothetical protein